MSDWFYAAVADWGAVALAIVTFLSCLAMPVPSSLMMLAAGAFAASGDLSLTHAIGAALAGAVLGDQAGFGVGRFALGRVEGWILRQPARAAVLARARLLIAARGTLAVFLSRWLLSPLGPYVNFIAGGADMRWLPFTLAGIAGEIVWVGVYVGLGYAFAANITEIATILGNASGLLASLVVTLGLGWMLWARRHPAS